MRDKAFLLIITLSFLSFFFSSSDLKAAESLYFIHQDHLGSKILVTDESGKIVEKQVYFPFGETRQSANLQLTNNNSKPITERQYTGQVSDQDETGLYYYNARYYNPQIAKFTQADSAVDGQNRYAYVKNNPVALSDPLGKLSARFDDEVIVSEPNQVGCTNCHIMPRPSNYISPPDWYALALQGDYSSIPPMGFANPQEMFDFERKYGSQLLFMRGEEGMRMQKAWNEFNSSMSEERLNSYWNEIYENQKNDLFEKYPELRIEYYTEKDKLSGAIPFNVGAYYVWGSHTVTLSDLESRPLANIALLQHEVTHFIDVENLNEQNLVSTEINAYFRMSQIPYLSDYDINLGRSLSSQFNALRRAGFSDKFIDYLYKERDLFNPSHYERLRFLEKIKN